MIQLLRIYPYHIANFIICRLLVKVRQIFPLSALIYSVFIGSGTLVRVPATEQL